MNYTGGVHEKHQIGEKPYEAQSLTYGFEAYYYPQIKT